MMETDLRDFLLGQTPITAIVAQRVYGMVREQGVKVQLPAVRIQRIHTNFYSTFCGTTELVDADLQVDSYGIDGDSAWALARALKDTLRDFSGNMEATSVDKVFLNNEFPLTDPDPGIIRVTQLYTFWYRED